MKPTNSATTLKGHSAAHVRQTIYSGNGPNGAGKLNLQLFDLAHVIKPTRGLDKRVGGGGGGGRPEKLCFSPST